MISFKCALFAVLQAASRQKEVLAQSLMLFGVTRGGERTAWLWGASLLECNLAPCPVAG